MPELLLELFSEEIPARMQKRASKDLKRLVTDGLKSAGLEFTWYYRHRTPSEYSDYHWATCRRPNL